MVDGGNVNKTRLIWTSLQLAAKKMQEFAEWFEDSKYITHIVSSPLTRTINIAFLSFPKAVERGIQVVLIPDLKTQFGKSAKELRELMV